MINRNIYSHSYNKENHNIINQNKSKYKKDRKLKIYVSPKMKKDIKGIILDEYDKNNEIGKQILDKNINEASELYNEKSKIKITDNSQSDTTFKSPEKNEIKTLNEKRENSIDDFIEKEKNEKNKSNNLYIIRNKENEKFNDQGKNKSYYNNKYNNLDKENDINYYNNGNNNRFTYYDNESKIKKVNNNSIIDFRHSNYTKYRIEREKNKKLYNSKRYNKNFENDKEKNNKEIKLYPTKDKIKPDINKNEYINNLFLKKKNKNKKSNESEESSQDYKKIEDNYSEENENEIKKVDITGYRYKIKNRPKKLELKNEILSEINNIKNQLLTNDYNSNKNDNDNDVIHKKIEINTTIESNYENKNLSNCDNIFDNGNNSIDKVISMNNERKSNNILAKKNRYDFIKRRYNSLENTKKEKNYIFSSKPKYHHVINNNINYYINTKNDSNYIDNNFNTNIQNQNYYQKVDNEKKQIPTKKRNNIKINNLIDYKYNYYMIKKNRKLKKLNNENISNKTGDINKLINDLLTIKNSKKKRFHREINKKNEEI